MRGGGIQNGLPCKFKSWPNLAPLEGFGIRPLLTRVRREQKSGGKRRQIRRPFHPDYYLLRIQNTLAVFR
jgi:hypothetical protein